MTQSCFSTEEHVLVIVTIHLMLLFQVTVCQQDERRPLYNIAHMVNSISEVAYYLDKGANAIESDVTFLPSGEARWIYHGFPCDCFRICDQREDVGKVLDYIRDITAPGHSKYRKELVLLMLDLKVSNLPASSKYKAGESVAEKLHRHLWNNGTNFGQVYVQLSIGHTYDYEVIKGARQKLTRLSTYSGQVYDNHIGWDVTFNDNIRDISEQWEKQSDVPNIWIADGSPNCYSFFNNNFRLKKAISEKKKNIRYSKVYVWTFDCSFIINKKLSLGIDAIITNHPERVLSILSQFDNYRMATKEDYPWEAINTYVKSNRRNVPVLDLIVNSVAEKAESFWVFFRKGTVL